MSAVERSEPVSLREAPDERAQRILAWAAFDELRFPIAERAAAVHDLKRVHSRGVGRGAGSALVDGTMTVRGVAGGGGGGATERAANA